LSGAIAIVNEIQLDYNVGPRPIIHRQISVVTYGNYKPVETLFFSFFKYIGFYDETFSSVGLIALLV